MARVIASSPIPGADEWYIGDYDEFPNLGEHADLSRIEAIAEILAGLPEHSREAFIAFVKYQGADYAENFEEAYNGEYESIGQYAYELLADVYSGEIKALPEYIANHIDWDSVGRDLELSGDYWTLATGSGGVWVFRNC
jgi:antirestriction protein